MPDTRFRPRHRAQPPGKDLRVFVYDAEGSQDAAIFHRCMEVLQHSDARLQADHSSADVAVAPLLQRKLSRQQLFAPRLGTLIFHPSLLPRHRGRDAIRWAFRAGEQYTGATWFWGDERLDAGDICEMEVLGIREGERPRQFYERAVVPAAARMLAFILDDLRAGIVRRRPQQEESATYEPPIEAVASTRQGRMR